MPSLSAESGGRLKTAYVRIGLSPAWRHFSRGSGKTLGRVSLVSILCGNFAHAVHSAIVRDSHTGAFRVKIAVMPGDGVGKEVVPEGLKVLRAAAERFGF